MGKIAIYFINDNVIIKFFKANSYESNKCFSVDTRINFSFYKLRIKGLKFHLSSEKSYLFSFLVSKNLQIVNPFVYVNCKMNELSC